MMEEAEKIRALPKPVIVIEFGTAHALNAHRLMEKVERMYLKETSSNGRIVDIDIQSVIRTKTGYRAFYKLQVKYMR